MVRSRSRLSDNVARNEIVWETEDGIRGALCSYKADNFCTTGIVGALSSWTTKNMAELTTKFPAPVISPMAASPELSDKTVYPYFMRTTPSSAEQIKVMKMLMNAVISYKRTRLSSIINAMY